MRRRRAGRASRTRSGWSADMQKIADAADISVLFFSSGANFGPFWVIFGPFFGAIFCGKILLCAI